MKDIDAHAAKDVVRVIMGNKCDLVDKKVGWRASSTRETHSWLGHLKLTDVSMVAAHFVCFL